MYVMSIDIAMLVKATRHATPYSVSFPCMCQFPCQRLFVSRLVMHLLEFLSGFLQIAACVLLSLAFDKLLGLLSIREDCEDYIGKRTL